MTTQAALKPLTPHDDNAAFRRSSEDNQRLWQAAIQSGWKVERARGSNVPEGLIGHDVVLYMESLFAHAVAKKLSLKLLEPEEDWLVKLPFQYRQRDVRLATLGDARRLAEPAFVKPPNEKLFQPKVFSSGQRLPAAYDDSMKVLIAEPVNFEIEYRCFILDRQVRTISPYLRHGQLAKLDDFAAPDHELAEAPKFAQQLLADDAVPLPRAVALDIGFITDRGWAVVELNAAWGSGIYGCDPAEVLAVIKDATMPLPTK